MTNPRFRRIRLLAGMVVCVSLAFGQVAAPPPQAPPSDPLGRDTPRGAVLGFLKAARKGDFETARRYLNAPLGGTGQDELARKLSVVLDRRLPPRLNQLSPLPEGSHYFPAEPDTDLVGTVQGPDGEVDIVLQRIKLGERGAVWMFSKQTLKDVPELYKDLNLVSVDHAFPAFFTQHKIAGIPLFHWIFALIGIPAIYALTSLLDKLISPLIGRIWSRLRGSAGSPRVHIVPQPVRLLLLALIIRWLVATLNLSLLTRQLWSSVAGVITIATCVWLLILLNSWGENLSRRRLERRGVQGTVSIVRLVRRTIDLLVVFGGALILLYYFNVNVTAALAGLGVGGIAVALAAQKTLENVIGGVSIIADQAMRVGTFVKVGATAGTVEDIGLRSTRIRTMDRSLVSIPNGQISNERLEVLSSRDKFWFHPTLSLRYDTTADQLRFVLAATHKLLFDHHRVERSSVRVRFLGFGSASLDLEAFAYISVSDFSEFLEIQEHLLLRIMDIVQSAGTRMALPFPTAYLAPASANDETRASEILTTRR